MLSPGLYLTPHGLFAIPTRCPSTRGIRQMLDCLIQAYRRQRSTETMIELYLKFRDISVKFGTSCAELCHKYGISRTEWCEIQGAAITEAQVFQWLDQNVPCTREAQ